MHERWYDSNPTLSMALSLTQNLAMDQQEKAAKHLFKILKEDKVTQETYEYTLRGIAFAITRKRTVFHSKMQRLIEALKIMPESTQEFLALELINYIYFLEKEADLFGSEKQNLTDLIPVPVEPQLAENLMPNSFF
ncbi:MAG: hypothetical protein AAGI66_06850 [Cyanobacteria bacterium P01_H01_bin.74]